MVQIVNRPGLGQLLGTGIGQGIGQGLSQLADLQLKNILQKKQKERGAKMWEQFGVPKDAAQAFAQAPEALQKSLFDYLEGKQIGMQQGGAPQAMQETDTQTMRLGAGQAFAQAPETLQKSLLDRLGGAQVGMQQGPAQLVQMLGGAQLDQLLGGAPQAMQETDTQEAVLPSGEVLKDTQTMRLGPGPQERRHRELLAEKKAARFEKEERELFKETKAERKEIIERAKAARQNISDLERMEELLASGQLDTPGFIEFAKRSGLDIPALMNPESQEFQKIATNFLRDAKQYFGGRITNQEMENFLKTLPSLSQSPEGMKRVIANLKRVNRMAIEYNDAMKEVIKQNKGVPPLDMMERIDDKIEKRLEAVTKQFKADLKKPVPPAQNKLVTLAQTAAGSTIGALASPITAITGLAKLLAG